MSDTALGNLTYFINGDNSGVKKSIAESEVNIKGFIDKLKGFGKLAIFGFAINEIINFGKELVKAASEAALVERKFNSTFSGIQDEAHKMAQSMADSFGFTEDAVMEVVQKTGYMLQSMGLSEKASLDLSASVYQLAVDMKAFAGGEATIAGAAEALTRALASQTRGLREYGIMLSPEKLKAYAEQLGVNLDYATAEQKAIITLNAIKEASVAVNGAYAKSMYGYSNQMMISKMLTNELHETMGKNLLPVAGLMARAWNNLQRETIANAKAMSDWIGQAENIDKLSIGIGILAGSFSALKMVTTAVLSEMGNRFLSIASGISAIISYTSSFVDALSNFGQSADEASGKTEKLEGSISPLGVAFGVLLQPVQAVKVAFNLVGASISFIVDNIIGLQSVLSATGATIREFAKAVISGDWSGYDKSLSQLGQTTAAYGQIAMRTTAALRDSAWNNITSFQTESQAMATQIMNVFGKSKADAEKMVQDAFKAKQQDALKKQLQDQAKVNEDNAKAEIALQQLIAKASGDATAQISADFKEKARSFEELAKKGGLSAEKIKQGFAALKDLEFLEKLKNNVNSFNSAIQTIGSTLTGLFSGISALQTAQSQTVISSLDSQMQAEEQAAGVAEKTAVQKAQREVDDAGASVTLEQQQALKKAQIEEKYAKQKSQLEYQMNLDAWNWKVATTTASVAMGVAAAIATASTAVPWPLAVAMMAIMGAMAAVSGGLQLAAVVASKPRPPQLASGGIIPGSAQGTSIIAGENNKSEMVVNQSQIKQVWDFINGKSEAGTQTLYRVAPLNKQSFFDELFKASQNGELFISERGLMPA